MTKATSGMTMSGMTMSGMTISGMSRGTCRACQKVTLVGARGLCRFCFIKIEDADRRALRGVRDDLKECQRAA